MFVQFVTTKSTGIGKTGALRIVVIPQNATRLMFLTAKKKNKANYYDSTRNSRAT